MPSKILRDSNEITDSKAIANAFNDFFTNIGHNLAQSIPDTAKPVMSFMPVQQSNSFFLNATSPKEIENEINMLKSSKSTGPNSIPISILKLLVTVISKPLECIFNCSLSTGVVPDKFKVASVIPIYKKGSISLLSIFNQILEKIIYKCLISFIEKHNILYKNQFGFHSKHSTIQAITMVRFARFSPTCAGAVGQRCT